MIRLVREEAALIASVGTTALVFLFGEVIFADLLYPLKALGLFIWLFAVMIWGSFAVVRHADCLAILLREPYGTLILTVSVITIEVALIASIMLTGSASPTLARDTMMAVLMIVLNGVVGLSLLIGGIRNVEQPHNFQGSQAFLAVIATLATASLILPRFTTSTADPSLTPMQSALFAAITILLYGTFLAMQTVRHRSYFVQPRRTQGSAVGTDDPPRLPPPSAEPEEAPSHGHGTLVPRSVGYHAIFLILHLLPLVLLSKSFAILVDYGTLSLQLPLALGGVVVAFLVLAPEGLAAIRAARNDQIQRSINLCLGSALATIGLTVPAVLAISLLTGSHVVLGVGATDMVLLMLTLFLGVVTFGGLRTNMLLGAVHLVVFLIYLVLVFDP